MKKALLLLIPGVFAAASCVTQTGDVAPSHIVQINIRATNMTSGYAADMRVLMDAGKSTTTVYSKNAFQGNETFMHEEKPVAAGTTFTAEVGFQPVSGQAGAVPINTTLTATILVDGVVKNTVTLTGSTPVNTAGARAATISATL
ncbi:hypothetical protein [Hymenobacter tenuis]